MKRSTRPAICPVRFHLPEEGAGTPRAVATPRPIKIRAETVRHGKYAPASGELVFTPGVAVVKVVSHGTSGLANDARLRQVEAQQREFEAKE